ncbi:hypothetical protein HPT29_017815 [Microvirga terrae]|uniref:Glycosyltransferase RgtA/B/C/D-like domain-containing protein n=1 Tax=Microvirga terrae TaxID=2740529 RepID=A0ABY5RQ87_9HYPH|nr:hypothetical protein [Microvirga terrae]UVF18357.1 hypothetical protein HPT29_017815 [Microvirga terrae]
MSTLTFAETKRRSLSLWPVMVALALFGVGFTALYLRARQTPAFADSGGYVSIAVNFLANGFNSPYGDVRTYGYPAFLQLVGWLSKGGYHDIVAIAPIVQAAVYLASAIWLCVEIGRRNQGLANAVFIGLLLNVVSINFLAYTLTEGLTVVTVILLTVVALRAEEAESQISKFAWLAIGTALASFAVMVRPANIPVFGVWTVTGLLQCSVEYGGKKRLLALATFAIQAVVISLLIFSPQIIYNYNTYGKLTFFPAYELGAKQTKWGIEILKYETFVAFDNGRWWAVGVRYLNPFYDFGPIPAEPVKWYFQNPLAAACTVLFRAFMSLNIEDIFIYLFNKNPGYSLLFATFTWFLVLMGGRFAVLSLRRYICSSSTWYEQRGASAIIFLAGVVISSFALNLLTAFENRFNAVTLAVIVACAAAAIVEDLGRLRPQFLISALAISAIFAVAADQYRAGYLYIVPEHRWLVPCTSNFCELDQDVYIGTGIRMMGPR